MSDLCVDDYILDRPSVVQYTEQYTLFRSHLMTTVVIILVTYN